MNIREKPHVFNCFQNPLHLYLNIRLPHPYSFYPMITIMVTTQYMMACLWSLLLLFANELLSERLSQEGDHKPVESVR